MLGARIALYISAIIATVICIMAGSFEIDELLKSIDRMPAGTGPEKYNAVTRTLPGVIMPPALIILLAYIASCVDKD